MYLFFSGKPGHNAVKVQTEEKQKQEKDKKATAISLAEMGLPVEQIARGVKESVSIVQAWITEAKTVVK